MNTRVDTTPDTRSSVCTLLCDELEKGYSIQHACDLVGVSYFMYAHWKRAADKGDDEAILLLRRLTQARARGLDRHVGPIRAAAEHDWRAAAWLIVKLYPSMRDGAPVEEIHLPDPPGENPNDQVKRELSTPERLAGLIQIATETGLLRVDVPSEQLLAKAEANEDLGDGVKAAMRGARARYDRHVQLHGEPEPTRTMTAGELLRASIPNVLRAYLVGAGGQPRAAEDAIATVVEETGCTEDEVKAAAHELVESEQLIEQHQGGIGRRMTTTWQFSGVRQRPQQAPRQQGIGDYIGRRRR